MQPQFRNCLSPVLSSVATGRPISLATPASVACSFCNTVASHALLVVVSYCIKIFILSHNITKGKLITNISSNKWDRMNVGSELTNNCKSVEMYEWNMKTGPECEIFWVCRSSFFPLCTFIGQQWWIHNFKHDSIFFPSCIITMGVRVWFSRTAKDAL